MQLLLQLLPNYLLVLCRISAFFFAVPVFSLRNVPQIFKIGLALFISLLVFLANETLRVPIAMDSLYALSIMKEVLIGLLLGFLAYLFFAAVQVAGAFIDIQIGFGIANVIDPMTGAQSPVLGNFKFIVATLLFLSLNGHHYLLQAIMTSYQWVPLSNEFWVHIAKGNVSSFLLQSLAVMFMTSFQLAAPLVVSLFLTDVALGLLARTAPQYNIFVVGLPVKLILGLAVLLLVIPGMAYLYQNLFASLFDSLNQLLALLSQKP